MSDVSSIFRLDADDDDELMESIERWGVVVAGNYININ